jgi:hypothetical protein
VIENSFRKKEIYKLVKIGEKWCLLNFQFE